MRIVIKKSESTILKFLSSLSENSLSSNNAYPNADVASDSENIIVVQSTSHGLDSDQENVDPDGSFDGTLVRSHYSHVFEQFSTCSNSGIKLNHGVLLGNSNSHFQLW